MKKFPIFLLSIAMLFLNTSVHAAAAKPKATPVPPHHTVIEAISATSITVKTPKNSKTYKITKLTTITFDGKTVTAADLKPGMKVSVTEGTDPDVAEDITANKAPKATPKPAKGK